VIVPTRRALIIAAALTPVALLGFAYAGALDVMLAADALLLALVIADARLAPGKADVNVARIAANSFSTGRETSCTYRWTNAAGRRARLSVRETRPVRIGGVLAPRDVEVSARGDHSETLPVRPLRRGRETAGWLAVRSTGPLGLAMRQWRVDLPWQVTVYPALPASRLKASVAEAVRRRDHGLRQARQLGEGRQFESLRAWVPGDDSRHIDWKATARRRKAIVRQYEEERRQQVLLVIDAGRLLTADVEGESRLEHVVRAALWLAFAANHHDDNVGVMVFADEVQHYVPPQRGRRGLEGVLDVLAVIEPKLVEPDYPAAFRQLAVRNRKRALTVVFTDVIDRLASEALVANVGSLRPRHLPLVVTLKNPGLHDAATAPAESSSDAYRKAAAEALLAEREAALMQMRRSGAVVLDVAPHNASRAVVDQYLELKRRGRL
jgi:uncharacterized protein (DUF58 family)